MNKQGLGLLYADYEVWLLKIRFRKAVGFTLWGCAGGENDSLIFRGGKLLLFKSPHRLQRFVRENKVAPFNRLPGFDAFKRATLLHKWSRLPYELFNLDDADRQLLQEDALCFKRIPGGYLLTLLNLFWDMCRVLGDEESTGRMRDRLSGGLGALMDDLLTNPEPNPVNFDRERVVADYKAIAARVRKSMLVFRR